MIHRFDAYNVHMNETNRDTYAIFSRYYDLEFDGFDADLDMYAQFVENMDGPVLELGCGSGRVLRHLQEIDLPLVGVDTSESMLEHARQRLDPRVQLYQQDIRFLDNLDDAPFALVFCAVNTFLHLPDVESQMLALNSVRRQTATGGVLLLDLLVPDPQYLSSLDGRMEREFEDTFDDGSRLDKWVVRTHDLGTQTIDTTVYYDVTATDGTVNRSVASYATRYIHHVELEHLLARTGWEIVSLFGGYDLEPFESTSERIIVLATPGS